MKAEQSGFTLLEILVSLTLFSLLSTALYSSLSLTVRTWQAGDDLDDGMDEIIVASQFIRLYLGSALNIYTISGDEVQETFEGGEGEITFITEMPAHLGYGGLFKVWIGSVEVERMHTLTVKRTLFHPDLIDETARGINDESVLLDDLDALEFSYYGQIAGAQISQWHDNWHKQAELPALIRIRITTNRSGKWPELLVRPRIDFIRTLRSL